MFKHQIIRKQLQLKIETDEKYMIYQNNKEKEQPELKKDTNKLNSCHFSHSPLKRRLIKLTKAERIQKVIYKNHKHK